MLNGAPLPSSPLRRLSPADFPPEQLAGWIEAGSSSPVAAAAPAPEGEADGWLVAYTDPRREDDVARTLTRRRFETYVPAMTVTRSRSDVRRPLLPRYVFVRDAAGQGTYGLRQTPGLEGLVRTTGQALARLKGEIVDGLREQEAVGVFDFTAQRAAALRAAESAEEAAKRAAEAAKVFLPGVVVRIVGGPWLSFLGRVDGLFPDDRIGIRMKIFGREMTMPMQLADVELLTTPLAWIQKRMLPK